MREIGRGKRKEDQELRRFVALCEKQSNKVAGKALCKCAAGSHNVCEASLCGCMSKHFTFIRKICSLIHLQYLCEELCFAVAFCEYEAYQGAASRCRSSFPQKFTLSACAALRAEQSFRSKCAHRKVRFSVAGIKLYLGAASRCFARKICSLIARSYPRKNFTLKKYVIML